jgi:hypothetical protein
MRRVVSVPALVLDNTASRCHTIHSQRDSRPDGSWPAYEESGGWVVTLTRAGHVQSIQVTGHDLPPQLSNEP